MGNKVVRDPGTNNLCTNDVVNDTNNVYQLNNFCTIAGFSGNNRAATFCEKIGGGSLREWEFKERSEGCQFCSLHPYKTCGSGCNHSEACGCAIWGEGTKCIRTSYNGDLEKCCWKDMYIAKGTTQGDSGSLGTFKSDNDGACFDDDTRSRTCDPNHRDITSVPCSNKENNIYKYCVGDDLLNSGNKKESADELLKRWSSIDFSDNVNKKPCFYYIGRKLFDRNYDSSTNSLKSGIAIQPEEFRKDDLTRNGNDVRILIEDMVKNYNSMGFNLVSPLGFSGYHPMGNTIFNICKAMPSLCTNFLNELCSGKTITETSANPILNNWCGCHLPPSSYERYTKTGLSEISCTPICNNVFAIPRAKNAVNIDKCKNNLCVLDDITINILNSRGGNVKLNQLCSTCKGSCRCEIRDVNIDTMNSSLGNGINLNEDCITGTECKRFDNKRNKDKVVPCSLENNINDDTINEKDTTINETGDKFRLIIIVFSIMLGIILILLVPAYIFELTFKNIGDLKNSLENRKNKK